MSRRALPARLLALAVLLAVPAAAAHPAAAQGPDDWVLREFEVIRKREGVEVGRELIPGASARDFDWHGVQDHGSAYPKGSITLDGNLHVTVPDRFQSGREVAIKAEATGHIATSGRDPGSTGYSAYIVLDAQCYDTQLCNIGDRQFKELVPGQGVDLAVVLLEKKFTIPTDPGNQPFNGLVHFHATLASTMPNDDYWTLDVYAFYDSPSVTPPAYTLEVDADTQRLPPSGATPSFADITATMRGADRNGVSGESLQFSLDPPDMGRLSTTSGVTDGQGTVRVRYEAPSAAGMRDRTSATVTVRNSARNLERGLGFTIQRYQLTLTVDPTTVPVEPVWRAIRVAAQVLDFEGRPVSGDDIQFRVDPPDLGEVIGASISGQKGKTDAGGWVEGFFDPVPASQFRGRDSLTLYATNLTHGGEQGVAMRFVGLHVIRTWPPQNKRDVELLSGDTIDIEFDRALVPQSVTPQNVQLTTLWHGNLQAQVEVAGSTVRVIPNQSPIPDVGLKVTVHVAGGENGPKGRDGSLLLGPYDLTFMTVPKLAPKIVVAQVVDEPRERLLGRLTVAPKPFSIRVEAGLSEDSELDYEIVDVTLKGPGGSEEVSVDQKYYPGRWPPLVPADAAARGNAALFNVEHPPAPGSEYTLTADLRPAGAQDDKTVHAEEKFWVNHWSNPAPATSIGILALPIVNERIPPFAWRTSRGQLQQWAATLGDRSAELLPLTRVGVRLGYLSDTQCTDPEKCRSTVGYFRYWVRHVGRAGFFTRGFQYVVAVVPDNFFDSLADDPDVAVHPNEYHRALESGIWSDRTFEPGFAPSSAFPVSLIAANRPGEVLAHALGDALNLAHSSADQDRLAGYDAKRNTVVVCNDEHCSGPYRSVMNELVGTGPNWISQTDYNAFLDQWTSRSGFNPRSTHAAALQQEPEVDLLLVSGSLHREAGGAESGSLDPLATVLGAPSLTESGPGDYAVELADTAGAVVARYPFQPVFAPAASGMDASFLTTVPAQAGVEEVRVTHGAAVLIRTGRSAHPPTVAFTQPAANTRVSGDVTVAWTGADADGDPLTYQLLFTADAGATWEPLLIDSTSTSLDLRTTDVSNGPAALLRVVASDGFESAAADLPLALDNPQQVLAQLPLPDAREVSPLTTVEVTLRDPLVEAPDLVRVFDGAGREVAGDVTYEPVGRTLIFTPRSALRGAERYEARLAGVARTPDGRTLGADVVWFFTTRGHALYLPRLSRSGAAPPAPSATTIPTRAPTRTPGPSPTATPSPTSPGASPTPTVAPPTPASPTATATPGAGVTTDAVSITGPDATHMQLAFAPGEPITLWIHTTNANGAPTSVTFTYSVISEDGAQVPGLSWSGPLEAPAGAEWFRLERQMPALASGPYTFTGTVDDGTRATSGTSELYVAGSLVMADDFASAATGWPAGGDANGAYGYVDGEYRLSLSSGTLWRWASHTALPALSNMIVEADARMVAPATGNVALVFGLAPGDNDFHILEVTRAGEYALYHWTGTAWETVLSPRPSPALRPGEGVNHLMVVRASGLTTFYANGRQVTMLTDVLAPAGRVGLYLSSDEAGVEARYDAFRTYTLP